MEVHMAMEYGFNGWNVEPGIALLQSKGFLLDLIWGHIGVVFGLWAAFFSRVAEYT